MAAVIIIGSTASWINAILETTTSTVTSSYYNRWVFDILECSPYAPVESPPKDYCPAANPPQQHQTWQAGPSAVPPRIRGPPVKIKPEHRDYLKSKINLVLIEQAQLPALYEAGNFPRSESVKDLQKRFCFDLLNLAGLVPWVCTEIYPYANDDHLYTALKSVCPTVVRKY